MQAAQGKTCVVGIKGGDFDFCQTAVKTVFNDEDFINKLKETYNMKLTSANSINWVRLIPQLSYSIYAYMNLVKVNIFID
jgi:threonine synthase